MYEWMRNEEKQLNEEIAKINKSKTLWINFTIYDNLSSLNAKRLVMIHP